MAAKDEKNGRCHCYCHERRRRSPRLGAGAAQLRQHLTILATAEMPSESQEDECASSETRNVAIVERLSTDIRGVRGVCSRMAEEKISQEQ